MVVLDFLGLLVVGAICSIYVVMQFGCHSGHWTSVLERRQSLPLSEVEGNRGEPREAASPSEAEGSRLLRRNNRAFGSLPHQTAPLPYLCWNLAPTTVRIVRDEHWPGYQVFPV